MDKEEDENETNKRQDDSSGQQSAVDNPSEDGCYIHVCGTSAQLLHMLSQIDMCTSTPVQVLELESLSEESESCQSSSPSSMTSTTPNSMSDETNYVIWAEPIMTCRLVPANPNGMADVRRIPPGARKVLPTTQTASTSCTTSNSSSGMPGTCRSSEMNNVNRRAMGDSTTSHHTIFSEALKKMASAADTIRQAKDVLSTLAVTREANNNNKTESNVGGDENANEGSTRDPATESSAQSVASASANKSQNSQKEADDHEIGKHFPEPILVRSFTNADSTLNSNSVDTKNMSMGDSGLSRSTLMTYASQSQQQSPRHQPNNRLRPHVNSNRAMWSSNMLDSDYQAARVARYPRLYGPTYRRMMENKEREENSKSLQPQNTEARDSGSYRFTDTSTLQNSLLNVGINSSAPTSEIKKGATVERRIPSVTKSCSTTVRNKITIVDLRAALDLAIRNLEKNELWKSINNNTYNSSASQGTKVSSNSFHLCTVGDLSLPRSCQQVSRTSGSPIENTKTENLKPQSNEAVVFKQHAESDQNGASGSGETGVGSASIGTVPKRSCSSLKTNSDESIESVYNRTPETQEGISKQKKTVEFLIPLAQEIEYTRPPTERPESQSSTVGQPGSLLEQDDAKREKEKSDSGGSEETSFLCSAQYELSFRPIKETRDFSCYINLANDDEPAASWSETYGNNFAGADKDSSENLTQDEVEENAVDRTDQRDQFVFGQKAFTLHRSQAADGNESMSPCPLEDEKVKSAFREVIPCRRKVITPELHACNGAFGEENGKDFSKGDDAHDNYSTWQSKVPEEPTKAVAPPSTDNIRPLNPVSVYQNDLFEESPLTLIEDSGGDWAYRNTSITCDKVMTVISEDDTKETEYFKIDPKLDLESSNKGYVAAEKTPIGDYSRLKAADEEMQDTDDESELVTMRSVSVCMSAASELSKLSFRAGPKRFARKYFHDRHISDLFRPSELDLLSEPLVIDITTPLVIDIAKLPAEESRKRSVQKETIIETDEIETIELGDETLNQTDQKPESKIYVTQSGTQLKSILATGQQKAKISTPTRVIARDLELVSIVGEDSDEEVKKVRWDMLSEPSSANSNDPKAMVKYTVSSTSLVVDDGGAGDDTTKEEVDKKPKRKRQPIRARIGRFLKSCLRLSK